MIYCLWYVFTSALFAVQ